MTEIKAADVKTLRDKTGLGIMECKAALKETGGNLEGAEKATGIRGEGDGPVIMKKSDLDKKEKVEVKTSNSNTDKIKVTKEGVPDEKEQVSEQKGSNEAKE